MTSAEHGAKLRHALFIAFHYPPEASSSGVLRTLKYTRFLPEFGWRVSVVAPDANAYDVRDPGLEAQIPSGVRVVRTRFLNVKRHLSFRDIYPGFVALPDVWIGWLPWAVRAARRIITDDPIDVIYSTSPHATAHVIARRLVKTSGHPWVTDFRDPWIEDPPEPGTPNGPIYRTLNRWLERDVVRRSAAVVASTAHLRDLLRERYANEARDKFHFIANGYDESDFAGLPTASRATLRSVFAIVHAGSINAGFRDPRPVFASLGAPDRSGPSARRRMRTAIRRRRRIWRIPGGEKRNRSCRTRRIGHFRCRAFPTSNRFRSSSRPTCCCCCKRPTTPWGSCPRSSMNICARGKPVLALVRTGAVTEIMEQTRGGWAVDPRDEAALDAALADAVVAWRSGTLADRRAGLDVLRRFDRHSLAGELARLFDSVSRSPATPGRRRRAPPSAQLTRPMQMQGVGCSRLVGVTRAELTHPGWSHGRLDAGDRPGL